MAQYGIQGWGEDPVWPAPSGGPGFAVLVYQDTVFNDGGWEIRIANEDSFPDARYRVHLGPNGDATDPVCYPGVPGAGEIADVVDGRFINVWSPPLQIGGPYLFFFESENLDGTGDPSDDPMIEVIPHLYRSRMLSIRRLFPWNYKTEYREAKRDMFPQV